jgi:hypothetical protein
MRRGAVTVMITRFQTACMEAVKELLSGSGQTIEFEMRELKESLVYWSKGEVSYVGCFESDGTRFEVWIYPDDAGFLKDGSWHVWEGVDFDSTDALLRSFIDGLTASINKGSASWLARLRRRLRRER